MEIEPSFQLYQSCVFPLDERSKTWSRVYVLPIRLEGTSFPYCCYTNSALFSKYLFLYSTICDLQLARKLFHARASLLNSFSEWNF